MKKLLYAIVLVSIILSGCDDFLNKTDPTATTFGEFFNDEGDLRRVTYSSFRDVFTHGSQKRTLFYFKDGMSDNAYSRDAGHYQKAIASGNYDANSERFAYYYNIHMKHIGRINTYLANIDEPYVEDEDIRSKYENILKGVRIWHYFHLTMRWGDVPFVLEPATLEEATVAPMPKEQVLDSLFMMGEKIANELPSEEYTTDKFMFNEYSLKALLMRYALYNERYELAARLAKEIMDSRNYELHPNYGDLFQYEADSDNNEFIMWAGEDSFKGATFSFNHLGPHYRTGSGKSFLVPLKSLVDSYWTLNGYRIENCPQHTNQEHELNPNLHRDPRYEASIMGNGDVFYEDTIDIYNPNSPMFHEKNRASASGYWFRKYVDEADAFKNGGKFEYGLLRYAEVLLTYAEAKIMLNDMDALAKDCINQIRERAGLDMAEADITLPRYSSYTQEQWIDLIQNERRIEFAAEGQRYNDIIRWGIAEEVLNQPALGDTRMVDVDGEIQTLHVEERSFQPHNYLWPFHESNLKMNPNLEQNSGY